MKTIFLFLFLSISLNAQTSHSQAEPLKVEWQKEISNFEEDNLSGILITQDQVIASTWGNILTSFNFEGEHQWTSAGSYGICMLGKHEQYIYTQGYAHIEKRDQQGNILHKQFLKNEDQNIISARNGQIWKGSLYTTNKTHLVLKYDLNGNLKFTKKIAENCDNKLLSAGGGFVYIIANIKDPSKGWSLVQYDTLGNQKWSKQVGDVHAMTADEEGNCFIMVANGETTIYKFSSQGEIIWSKLLNGQYVRGASMSGDRLLLCGNISLNAIAADNKQSCAYSILSSKTGETISQQTITVNNTPNLVEQFSQIATDGTNLYIGGSVGSQSVKCFLLKLNSEGNTTGVGENKSGSNFSIFPNPSGSKFTISCNNTNATSLKITVRNSLGQVVQTKDIQCEGAKSWEFDLDKQPAGNYSVEIVSGKDKVVKKVVIE